MKRNRILIGLLLICMFSVSINIFQFFKMKNNKTEEKLYTETFQKNFDNLDESFDLYTGSGALSNQSAIKNSVSIIGNLKDIRSLSSYKENKSLSLMLLYLSQFFVLNSDQYINENIDNIRPQLNIISKNLNDENAINNFNFELSKMIYIKHQES